MGVVLGSQLERAGCGLARLIDDEHNARREDQCQRMPSPAPAGDRCRVVPDRHVSVLLLQWSVKTPVHLSRGGGRPLVRAYLVRLRVSALISAAGDASRRFAGDQPLAVLRSEV